VHLEDNAVETLAKDFDNRIKQQKENMYRLSWYMRGGIRFQHLMYDTDIEDVEIIQNIIKDNIENTKSSRLPLL
jgi:hypothetical protein